MLRASGVGAVLGLLIGAPAVIAALLGIGPEAFVAASADGLLRAVDDVGWVLLPQLLLAIAVLGLALERLASRAAGLGARRTPGWLDPAVESALLLGMLGTISGMVSGFVGLSPDELEPGPLVHSLGTALRSSFVGFGIALVGVWVKARPAPAGAPAGAAAAPPQWPAPEHIPYGPLVNYGSSNETSLLTGITVSCEA